MLSDKLRLEIKDPVLGLLYDSKILPTCALFKKTMQEAVRAVRAMFRDDTIDPLERKLKLKAEGKLYARFYADRQHR
jgi:hypothetical protein